MPLSMNNTPRRPRNKSHEPHVAAKAERLQKLLATAGYGSRRQCEELILDGRVEVNRQIVDTLGTRVDLQVQEIRVDGELLPRRKLVYYVVHKPPGVVSTSRDPAGRPRVIDLVPDGQHLFTVGRLDRSSEGLIVVTNDGELAQRLAHPRYEVEKTYLVDVAGHLSPRQLNRLRHGVHLSEAFAKAVRIQVKRTYTQTTQIEIVLNEGRNREIRRVLARVGHKVLRLRRTALGSLRLGNLPKGAVRQLTRQEVTQLYGETDRGGTKGRGRLQKNIRRRTPNTERRAQGEGRKKKGKGRRANHTG